MGVNTNEIMEIDCGEFKGHAGIHVEGTEWKYEMKGEAGEDTERIKLKYTGWMRDAMNVVGARLCLSSVVVFTAAIFFHFIKYKQKDQSEVYSNEKLIL